MIFKLEYKNKDLDVARLEITTPGLVEKTIEGTEDPFRLIYKLDKSDKSGHFLTSSAEINIYETPEFNIDALKTSNETEIKVDYYINNEKKWTGFVIPDFFSKEIGKRSVVSMVASDRIGTLKGVTLTDLNAFVSLRTLAEQCLLKTGLSLPLNTMVDLEADAVNFFNIDALSQRLVDNKGRSISCYDILSSILVASNSIILQRNAEWYIVNKLQHELGQGKLYSNSTTFTNWQDIIHNFSDVAVGARRTIIPVAASTGVYHEHGGGMLHPDNYDFSKGLTGWTSVGGFVAAVDNKEIKGFTTTSSGAVYTPVYGNATEKSYLINENEYIRNVNPKYIESEEISIPYNGQGSIDVEVNVNALAAAVYATPVFILPVIRIAVVATNGSDVLTLDYSGKFITMPSINPPVHEQTFEKGEVKNVGDIIPFLTEGKRVKGTLEVSNLEQYKLKIRIYGTQRAVYFHSVDLLMRNTAEAPKGTIFKTEQGSNYTKEHEIDTSIFGDYMTGGLNGYFYKYPIDDTSSLYSNGVLTSKWTDITDQGVERSLLHHITTQRSRMFSQAHDLVSAEMDIRLFDPLSIYVACSKRYTLVSATVDFLRGRANLEIEEVVFQNLIKRDFIYSYFGDGETGVKSIGGISVGASGGASIDSGLIGGINERIDDVNDKVNNIKVGPANLLLNTGFLGDFQSLTVDALTAVTGSTPINTNPLAHWVYSNTEVVDAPSRSGKGVKIGSIQQTVTLKQGSHVLSFWAKGNSLTVDLVESVPVSIDSEYKKYSFDITVANSGAHTFSLSGDAYIYEIMLSEGNAEVSYSYSEEDDLKAIAQLQAINVITDAIKNYDTDILGGLILTSMIQLGKYKDGVMERVNAGISGIYNNDNDPAVWAGGSMEMAIRTVQKFISNPNYQPTEEEWDDMAKIVFTHGGDGFFRGYIYALGGFFRGRIESNVSGNRIIVNPENRSIEMINSQNRLSGQIFFSEGSGWGAVQFYDYHANGTLKTVAALDLVNGVYFSEYADGNPVPVKITYSKNGQIQNGGIPSMTDAQADTLLVSGEWYRDGRTLKIKP